MGGGASGSPSPHLSLHASPDICGGKGSNLAILDLSGGEDMRDGSEGEEGKKRGECEKRRKRTCSSSLASSSSTPSHVSLIPTTPPPTSSSHSHLHSSHSHSPFPSLPPPLSWTGEGGWEVGRWLEGFRFGRFGRRFLENGYVEIDVVCAMGEEDFQDMGIPQGARVKLVKEVEVLRGWWGEGGGGRE